MRIQVFEGDVTKVDADVLALKYAQARFGVDESVAKLLLKAGSRESAMSPEPGGFRLLDSAKGVSARRILFVGVEQLWNFSYSGIRQFARNVLSATRRELPHARHILATVHGAGYGLDEEEAFQSEIAGFLDGIATGDAPESLEFITVVERDPGRVRRLKAVLDHILPDGEVDTGKGPQLENARSNTTQRLSAFGDASASKAHIFVAMPFADEMDDVYHYGIVSPVKGAGYLCERADLSAFTGDVITWVKERITTASLVIAELSGANPNVYLEVGFAWGCGIPTVLLSRETADLLFDVRGQRCLVYKKIKDLEKLLAAELEALKIPSGHPGSGPGSA